MSGSAASTSSAASAMISQCPIPRPSPRDIAVPFSWNFCVHVRTHWPPLSFRHTRPTVALENGREGLDEGALVAADLVQVGFGDAQILKCGQPVAEPGDAVA